MPDKNWVVLADDEAMDRFMPDREPPDSFRVLVGEVNFRWASEPPPEQPPVLQPYSQRDPRWKGLEYAPGYTFGAAGCYVTCIAMMLSLGGYNDDPSVVAWRLTDRVPGMFVNGNLVHPEEIPNVYPQMEWAGKLDWTHVAADMDRVHHELERGPVIMQVDFVPTTSKTDSHFVVAEDFTPDGDDLLIVDSLDGSHTRLLERYAQEHWDLARAIYGLRLLRVSDH